MRIYTYVYRVFYLTLENEKLFFTYMTLVSDMTVIHCPTESNQNINNRVGLTRIKCSIKSFPLASQDMFVQHLGVGYTSPTNLFQHNFNLTRKSQDNFNRFLSFQQSYFAMLAACIHVIFHPFMLLNLTGGMNVTLTLF